MCLHPTQRQLLVDAATMGYPGDQQVLLMLEPLRKALSRVEAGMSNK
jgi:hypothetical protein